VGGGYEIPFLVRSRGPLPTGDAALLISIPSGAVVIDSLDAGGARCTQPDATTWRCALGVIAPGDTRLVRLLLHGSRPATADINAMADVADDGFAANNFASVQLRIDNPVDLAVVIASGGAGVEDAEIEGQVALRSGGRQSAANATLDVDLNAAGVLLSASIHNGAACTLITPQRAHCALPSMARGTQLFVDYRAMFTEPGTYDVKFTATAPGDTAADNDTLTRPVLVRPYNDIAVAGALDLGDFLVGETRETTFTVTTDRRALGSARFLARHYLPGLRVEAIRASAGSCQVDADVGGTCDFTDLQPFASISVTVTWRAAEASDAQDVSVGVSTAGDVVSGNNSVSGRAEVVASTDLELRVAGAMDGSTGTTLAFPQISVVNGGERAIGTRLEVTLPPQVTLIGVSAANAICSGTAVLRCDFPDLDANSTSTVDINVRASTRGSYMSSLKLTSSNDINPANDSREVMFEISGSSGVAAASKSSGGGRMEWLALAVLALLVGRRGGNGVIHRFLGNGE
jgi:hypothetical protein